MFFVYFGLRGFGSMVKIRNSFCFAFFPPEQKIFQKPQTNRTRKNEKNIFLIVSFVFVSASKGSGFEGYLFAIVVILLLLTLQINETFKKTVKQTAQHHTAG